MPENTDTLPEQIRSRLGSPNLQNDLTKRPVALELFSGKRPYYSAAQMRAALGSDHSKETVKSRLDELVEIDVAKKDEVNNGGIYWANRRKSNWPIPSDVEVEAARTEPTVSEFLTRLHIQVVALGIAIALAVEAILVLALYTDTGAIPFPLSAEQLYVSGFTGIVISWLLFAIASVVWMMDVTGIRLIERART